MDNSLYLHYTNEYIEGYPFYSLEISKNDDINDNILIDTYDESNFRTENTLIQKEQQTYVKLFAIPYGFSIRNCCWFYFIYYNINCFDNILL